MRIEIEVVKPIQAAVIRAQVFAGEEATFDLAALNEVPDLHVRSIGQPAVGAAVLEGAVVRYTPPADFEGDVVIPYDARQKLGPVRVG